MMVTPRRKIKDLRAYCEDHLADGCLTVYAEIVDLRAFGRKVADQYAMPTIQWTLELDAYYVEYFKIQVADMHTMVLVATWNRISGCLTPSRPRTKTVQP